MLIYVVLFGFDVGVLLVFEGVLFMGVREWVGKGFCDDVDGEVVVVVDVVGVML